MSISKSSSGSTPQSMPGDLTGLRSQVNAFMGNLLRGGNTALSTPMGAIGSAYQNLYGDNPSKDFLGARGTLERLLSGEGYKSAYGQAYDALAPLAQRSIDLSNQKVLGAGTGQGLRFSTDIPVMQAANARDILLGTQGQAAGNANAIMGQQLQGAQGVYSNVLQGALAQMPLDKLLQYATQFAPVGNNSSSSGWSAGINFGVSR